MQGRDHQILVILLRPGYAPFFGTLDRDATALNEFRAAIRGLFAPP